MSVHRDIFGPKGMLAFAPRFFQKSVKNQLCETLASKIGFEKTKLERNADNLWAYIFGGKFFGGPEVLEKQGPKKMEKQKNRLQIR